MNLPKYSEHGSAISILKKVYMLFNRPQQHLRSPFFKHQQKKSFFQYLAVVDVMYCNVFSHVFSLVEEFE